MHVCVECTCACARVCAYVLVCVCVRERERDRKGKIRFLRMLFAVFACVSTPDCA